MKIELKDWEYICSDGCCTDYGTKILIDGVEIEHYKNTREEPLDNAYVGNNTEVAILSVLNHLGIHFER